MAFFRVEHNSNYTVLSNYHLRDKKLSLKAIGLLSLMLSLPEDWDYSMEGLVTICKENKTAIHSALNELKESGYLKVTKLLPNQTKTGRIEYIYDVYEVPKQEGKKQGTEILCLENQGVEIQGIENQPQINKDIQSTNILNTNKQNSNTNNKSNKVAKQKPIKHRHGTYAHVLLTDEEYQKLLKDYANAEECIKYLDEYIEMKGYKANSHYLAIKKWVVNAVEEHKQRKNGYNNYQRRSQRVIPVDNFMKQTTDEDYEKKRRELFDDFKKDS